MERRSKTKLYFPGYIINFTTFLEAVLVSLAAADALKLQQNYIFHGKNQGSIADTDLISVS